MIDRLMVIGLTLACAILAVVLYRHRPPVTEYTTHANTIISATTSPISAAGDVLEKKLPLVEFRQTPLDLAILQLGFCILNEIIVISTYGDFEPYSVTMAHNVSDIIARLQGQGYDAEGAIERINFAVTYSVEPAAWQHGGGLGRLENIGGQMLITQPAKIQIEVGELLEKLRGPEGNAIFKSLPPIYRR